MKQRQAHRKGYRSTVTITELEWEDNGRGHGPPSRPACSDPDTPLLLLTRCSHGGSCGPHLWLARHNVGLVLLLGRDDVCLLCNGDVARLLLSDDDGARLFSPSVLLPMTSRESFMGGSEDSGQLWQRDKAGWGTKTLAPSRACPFLIGRHGSGASCAGPRALDFCAAVAGE